MDFNSAAHNNLQSDCCPLVRFVVRLTVTNAPEQGTSLPRGDMPSGTSGVSDPQHLSGGVNDAEETGTVVERGPSGVVRPD